VARRLVQALPLQHHHRQGRHDGEIYKRHFVPNNAVYLTTVGYGTGALLGRGISASARPTGSRSWAGPGHLGAGGRELRPFLVDSDLAGNSLFERENAKIAPASPSCTPAPSRPRCAATARPTTRRTR
jgi:hypothetical protein